MLVGPGDKGYNLAITEEKQAVVLWIKTRGVGGKVGEKNTFCTQPKTNKQDEWITAMVCEQVSRGLCTGFNTKLSIQALLDFAYRRLDVGVKRDLSLNFID